MITLFVIKYQMMALWLSRFFVCSQFSIYNIHLMLIPFHFYFFRCMIKQDFVAILIHTHFLIEVDLSKL